MASRTDPRSQARRSAFAAESQQRIELNAQIAGIAGAFGKAAELGPPAWALQQALVAGLARSQRVEAERLAARHGQDDPRVADAAARAAQYADLEAEATTQITAAARVVETLQRKGLFSGYVYGADAAPAAGYTVRLEIADAARKQPLQASAQTGADGFFTMALASDADDRSDRLQSAQAVVERFVRAMHAEAGSAATAAAAPARAASAAAATEASSVTSRAQVLDPNGRVVYEDPEPPTFEGVESEFRTYVLDEKGAGDLASLRSGKR